LGLVLHLLLLQQFDLEVKIHNEKILKQFDEEYERIINEVKEAARNGKDEMMGYVSNRYFVKPIQQKLLSEGFDVAVCDYGKYEDYIDRILIDQQKRQFLISWRKQ
jgi:uncharacterized protein YukJ